MADKRYLMQGLKNYRNVIVSNGKVDGMNTPTYATQKTELATKSQPVSVVLDPEFIAELQANAKAYDAIQENADNSQWTIARIVNGMYSEHKSQFINAETGKPDKGMYYAECSRVANIGLKKSRFSESGETLRRWCEVQSLYAPFSWADQLLDKLSFSHLQVNKKLHKDGKVKTVLEALERAIVEKWTSDEMREHFDPSIPPHPYELIQGRLAGLQNWEDYPFLKDRTKAEECAAHAAAINKIIREYVESEGKSAG